MKAEVETLNASQPETNSMQQENEIEPGNDEPKYEEIENVNKENNAIH